MYDLAGADEGHRFSPYCWRIRLALAHKGLSHETVPCRFAEKETLAFSGQERVPVIVDGDRVVSDSWEIAGYLEEAYPDRPPLFGCAAGRGEALFVKHWSEQVVHPLLLRIIVLDVYSHLHPKDKEYFRRTREQRFGMTLEAFCAEREHCLPRLREALAPLRETVRAQAYLGGETPSFADYIAFGAFQWARCTSEVRLLAPEDPVEGWRHRLLALHDGLARRAPAVGP